MFKRTALAVIALIALVAPFVSPAPAQAADEPFEVFASELDNPRGLEFGTDGSLYIAEGGEGGDDCNDDDSICYGPTGAITRVTSTKTQSRVLTGLPSILATTPEGEGVSGPTDVSLFGGIGYYMVATDGGIFTHGDAQFFGSEGGGPLNQPIVDMATSPTGLGYRLFASDGGVFTHGDAQFFGSEGSLKLNKPMVGGIGTASGKGYGMVATDGGVFTHGDFVFFGSMGDKPLNKPIVAMVPTPTGKGYILIAEDGGIFTFGDAIFFGSMGDKKLNQPIVGAIPTPSGKGYIMVASDGGIFTFGDAAFFGSMGGSPLNSPIVDVIITPTGKGYWLIAADGGVFAFGDAVFLGSQGAKPLNKPVVGADVTPMAMAFTVGLGADPDMRTGIPSGKGGMFATANLATGNNTSKIISDLGAFEKANNPDKNTEEGGVDTNPYAILLRKGFALAADAGGNSILNVAIAGLAPVTTLGTALPMVTTTDPDAQAVPTSIVVGPDGAYYIGQLTGFPFAEGASTVWRWSGIPTEAPTAFAGGFNTVTDIAFGPDGTLYVSELNLHDDPPVGQVTEVKNPGKANETRRIVMNGLFFNTGLTVGSNGWVYVTHCGVCTDAGMVLRFDPKTAPDGGIVGPGLPGPPPGP